MATRGGSHEYIDIDITTGSPMTAVARKSDLITRPHGLTGELWVIYCEDLEKMERVITAPHCMYNILYLKLESVYSTKKQIQT